MSNGFMKCLIFLLQILKDKMIPSIDVTTYFHDANMVFKQKKKTIITIKMGMIQVC